MSIKYLVSYIVNVFCTFLYILEVYKKIDASMHPELDRAKLKELHAKEESQQRSWWKSFKGAVTKLINPMSSSDKDEYKCFPVVKTYLAQYHKFITGRSNLNLSSVEVFDEIMHIVMSLLSNSFYINGRHDCLLGSDIKQVRN